MILEDNVSSKMIERFAGAGLPKDFVESCFRRLSKTEETSFKEDIMTVKSDKEIKMKPKLSFRSSYELLGQCANAPIMLSFLCCLAILLQR